MTSTTMQESIVLNKTTLKPALYICPTPIGNLSDITIRVLETLQNADIIAAEDTRHTRKLLTHYDIHTPLISYHKHNHKIASEVILEKLRDNQSVALVSDAGTPIISDPGQNLVKECIENGYEVISLPGASASITALVGSGMCAEQFLFIGFLDRNKGRQIKFLKSIAHIPYTLIFYESPHRLIKTLSYMLEVLGDREITLAREITKKYEEYIRGTISQIISLYNEKNPKGEFVILVAGAKNTLDPLTTDNNPMLELSVEDHIRHLISTGMRKKDASMEVATLRALDKKEIYKLAVNLEIE